MIAFIVPGQARPEAKRQRRFRGKDGTLQMGARTDLPDRADWKAVVRHAAAQAMGDDLPFEGPLTLIVTIMRPKPPSWPKRACKRNLWPWAWWKKPDTDNLTKPIKDAISRVVWLDDAQVVREVIEKIHSEQDLTVVRVIPATQEELVCAEAKALGVVAECRRREAQAKPTAEVA